MIILDTTAKSLRAKLAGAVSANQPIFTVAYADTDGTTFTEGSNDGTFNSTTEVTLLAAPASGHRRIIKSISIYNADTANVTYSLYMLVTAAVQIIEKRTLTTLSSKLYGFDAAVNPFDQDLFTGSSPTFAGLTIDALAGFLFGTAGAVSAKNAADTRTALSLSNLDAPTFAGLGVNGTINASGPNSTAVYALDVTNSATLVIANGAGGTATIFVGNTFGGLLIVHDLTNGDCGVFIAATTTIALLGAPGGTFSVTKTTGNKTNVYSDSGNSWILTIENRIGSSQTYAIMALRTRTQI